MNLRRSTKGFTLIEVVVATAIFLIFALGVYGGLQLVFKIVYESRLRILETAVLSERLEAVHNLPYDSIGISGGIPAGILPHTTTTVRNGVTFNLTTTVRNIDDPFDGTLGGTPNDTAPADYKLVEMSIICDHCAQQGNVILNTIVAPKKLEGASKNGALFIHTMDANGHDVPGANVHITNDLLTPHLIVDDVTGNEGWLRIVDTPTSSLGYNITVSKAGYSTDGTGTPLKMPATVVSQTPTEIYFTIDRLSDLNIRTVNPSCAAMGNVAFNLHGEKLVDKEPDVYKYSADLTTDASGEKSLPNMEFDTYYFIPTGYDVGGSAPVLPSKLEPGTTQNLTVVLRPHVASSLLVKVLDAGTKLPLSNATIHLFGGTYDKTLTTGLGYSRQTDWSGGAGQDLFADETKYSADSGTLDVSSPAGDIKLKKVGSSYLQAGWLESSIIDLGTKVDFNSLLWIPSSQPAQTGTNPITFQIATSDTSTPASWDYLGPDGTATGYYTASNNAIWPGADGSRFIRYKVFLNTADTKFTPQVSEVSFTYTNDCTPPGQAFFNDVPNGTYTLEVSHNGYTVNSGSIDVTGNTETASYMSPTE